MENDLDRIRAKLMGVAGTPLEDEEMLKVLKELLNSGGGALVELDRMNYKLLRRDGKFVFVRDPRRPPSNMPPPR